MDARHGNVLADRTHLCIDNRNRGQLAGHVLHERGIRAVVRE